jgi:archaellum biogenesis ATPase FlaH
MSARGERVLCQHLDNVDSLRALALDGLVPDLIPTEEIRAVYEYAMHYYYESGQQAAPSMELLEGMFGDVFGDNEIDITEEPPDTIEWAIENLKSDHVQSEFQVKLRDGAAAMNEAPPQDKIEVLNEVTSELIQLSIQVEEHAANIELQDGMHQRVQEYVLRSQREEVMDGMYLPFDEVNDYTFGIHPGELAVMGGAPKVGKSLMLDLTAWKEYQRDRVVVLYTLENTVEMTLDRIICIGAGVRPDAFQRGECSAAENERIAACMDAVCVRDARLMVCQPDIGKRTVQHLIRDALARDADSVIIDQMSYIELPKAASKTNAIGDVLHSLHNMITTGRRRLPVLLANQVSREGVKLAQQTGHLEMYHMADSAEIERTADWVFGLWQTQVDRGGEVARLQTLGARRQALRDFLLHWSISTSTFSVQGATRAAVDQ